MALVVNCFDSHVVTENAFVPNQLPSKHGYTWADQVTIILKLNTSLIITENG